MTSVADVHRLVADRTTAGLALADAAETVARACHAMAQRFHDGGRLMVFGDGGCATDAAHIAVEFVHPVVVGKRALPAFSLAADPAVLTGLCRDRGAEEVYAAQLRVLAGPADIALGLSPDGRCPGVRRGLEQARAQGLLTVALAGAGGGPLAGHPAVDHLVTVASDDPLIVKEVQVSAYHVLWELVHVFFEHPGVLAAAS